MPTLGPVELAIFGVVAVVLFGGNLPDVARKLGASYASLRSSLSDVQREFRMAQNEVTNTIDRAAPDAEEVDETPPAPTAPKFRPPG